MCTERRPHPPGFVLRGAANSIEASKRRRFTSESSCRPGSGTVREHLLHRSGRDVWSRYRCERMSRRTRPSGCTRASSPRGTISPGSPSSSTGGDSASRRQQGPSAPSSISCARTRRRRAPAGWRSSRTRTPHEALGAGRKCSPITTRRSSCASSTTSRLPSGGPLAERACRKIGSNDSHLDYYIFVSCSHATYDVV